MWFNVLRPSGCEHARLQQEGRAGVIVGNTHMAAWPSHGVRGLLGSLVGRDGAALFNRGIATALGDGGKATGSPGCE